MNLARFEIYTLSTANCFYYVVFMCARLLQSTLCSLLLLLFCSCLHWAFLQLPRATLRHLWISDYGSSCLKISLVRWPLVRRPPLPSTAHSALPGIVGTGSAADARRVIGARGVEAVAAGFVGLFLWRLRWLLLPAESVVGDSASDSAARATVDSWAWVPGPPAVAATVTVGADHPGVGHFPPCDGLGFR
jgi:hypothetical protein